MRLNRDKINSVSKEVLTSLLNDDRVELFAEDNDIRLDIVAVITRELVNEEQVEEKVRSVVTSYAKNIREGTPEWDVLYSKHYHEEIKKSRGI